MKIFSCLPFFFWKLVVKINRRFAGFFVSWKMQSFWDVFRLLEMRSFWSFFTFLENQSFGCIFYIRGGEYLAIFPSKTFFFFRFRPKIILKAFSFFFYWNVLVYQMVRFHFSFVRQNFFPSNFWVPTHIRCHQKNIFLHGMEKWRMSNC